MAADPKKGKKNWGSDDEESDVTPGPSPAMRPTGGTVEPEPMETVNYDGGQDDLPDSPPFVAYVGSLVHCFTTLTQHATLLLCLWAWTRACVCVRLLSRRITC